MPDAGKDRVAQLEGELAVITAAVDQAAMRTAGLEERLAAARDRIVALEDALVREQKSAAAARDLAGNPRALTRPHRRHHRMGWLRAGARAVRDALRSRDQ